jgi:hypothetical protein
MVAPLAKTVISQELQGYMIGSLSDVQLGRKGLPHLGDHTSDDWFRVRASLQGI